MALYKPAGFTSHDVVARVRRLTRERSVGHTGTLDPEATGVLVLCLGRATRLSRFLMDMPKAYEAEIVFGSATTTGDSHGQVVARMDGFTIPREAVVDALHKFTGEISRFLHGIRRALRGADASTSLPGRASPWSARPGESCTASSLHLDAWPEPIVSGSSVRIAVECSKARNTNSVRRHLRVPGSAGPHGQPGAYPEPQASSLRNAPPSKPWPRPQEQRITGQCCIPWREGWRTCLD